jgi:cell wall-associated NlpC family hydrolase
VWKRTGSAAIASFAIAAAGAPSALAGGTGGVSAAPSTSAAGGSSTATHVHVHTDPVTAKTPNLTYKGPVYEKTTTGELVPYVAAEEPSQAAGTSISTGGAAVEASAEDALGGEGKPDLMVPGTLARYVDGLAAAPESAPAAIQEIIWAGNQLIGLPYIYGGGHDASFVSPGYDCSGTVSFALHGADLLSAPEDSSEFMAWGAHGLGRWVTIFSNAGHAYMTVAGLRLDTSAADDPSNEQGPRWRPLRQSNSGYAVRHPPGL